MHLKYTALLIAAAAATFAAAAHAQNLTVRTPAERTKAFKVIGGAFKAVNDELKKDDANLTVIRTHTARIKALSVQAPRWFPAGTGPRPGVETEAKPEIWSDPAGFSVAMRRFQSEASALEKAASSGEIAQVRTQVRATGGSCKGCHDKFRAEKKS